MANRRLVMKAGGNKEYSAVTSSYTTLLSGVEGRGVVLQIANSLNSDVYLSLDGGTTEYLRLPAATSNTIDLGSNGAEFSGTISVKYGSAAPTSGFIYCGVIRVN